MIEWHYPRNDLATSYMNAFSTGITGALALFAPRRMGKTEFVLLDLAPAAEERGYQVAYCSFWNLQDNPAKALRLALETMSTKGNWKQKWASYVSNTASEISANIGGASFKLKHDIPSAEENDLIAIIELLGKLARQKKQTLIICDEVQHLADDKHAALVATLRTQFEQHRSKLHVVYTGSSRDGLQRMFRDRRTPMFHAAQQVDFPHLESEFVAFMLNAFEKASQKKLPLAGAARIFKKMNNNPSLFHHLLRHMVIAGIWDIEKGFEHFHELVDINSDYSSIWNECKSIDQEVLKRLAHQLVGGIYSDSTRNEIGSVIGVDSVSVKSIQHAIDRLRSNQIIFSVGRGNWVFEDPSFQEWVVIEK